MDRPRVSFPASPDSDSPPGEEARAGTPRADALTPGARLEEFQIERVIGTSGFGLVYLANDEAFERRVAIKEYLPDTLAVRGEDGAQVLLRAAAHAEAFERGRRAFVEEAQLLARCQNPSLVHVLRSWEANGTVYRAMPYYAGHSLLALREAMPAPPDEASLRALLEGLLEALQALHDAGTLHREVAPGNILLLPDDRPVLLDMSAARRAIVGDQARALMTLLAPSFAPLEQTAPSPDRPQGPWTDLYALAAVVKYCICGKLPPPASLSGQPPHEPMAAVVRRQQERFPLLHFSTPFLSAIDAALAQRPEDRPQSVDEFRALLNDTQQVSERIEPLFTDSGEIPLSDEPRFAPTATTTPTAVTPPAPQVPQPTAPAAVPAPPPRQQRIEPRLARAAERPAAPVFGFADSARRRRRRVAWASALLLLVAAGSAAWIFDQQRYSVEAQAAFADAARHDGLTANVPVVPKPADAGAEPTPEVAAAAPSPPPEAPAVEAKPPVVAAAPAQTQQAPPITSSAGTESAGPPPPTVTASAQQAEEPEPAAAPAPQKSPTTAKKPSTRSSSTASRSTRTATASASRSSSVTKPTAAEHSSSPRDACGNRTEFSLYRCMQTQCAQAQWSQHPVCKRLRARDEVD